MKSAFSRLFVTVAILLLTAMVLNGVVFQTLASRYMTKNAIASLENDCKVIAQLVQASYMDQGITEQDFYIALSVAASVSEADAVICNAQGELLICADAPLGCEHRGLKLDSDYRERIFESGGCTDTGMIEGLYDDVRYVVSYPVVDGTTGQRLAIVMVSSPVDSILSIMNKISEIFMVVSILVVTIAVVAMVFFARKQASPLRHMAQTASAFGHGDLTARVHTDGNNSEEVEELALAFNNMASLLQKSEYQRQEFVANVSHELKTPMTTISGYIDGILDGTIPPEKSRQYLTIVSDETKRLSRLVRSMLDISRLQDQGGITDEQKNRFDVTELAGQVLITFEQKINGKDLDVQVEMPEHPVYTRANQDSITQVVYNLVDNAVKFCPPGGTLGVKIREGGSKIYLSVENDGETIPPEELSMVFERFHKIDKSRSANRDSWGLGLYIVKTIVNSHGENISVTSDKGKTNFTFTLPLVP